MPNVECEGKDEIRMMNCKGRDEKWIIEVGIVSTQ
jgi:hypothetical protein